MALVPAHPLACRFPAEGDPDGRRAPNYIDGKWVDAQDGARFDVFNPATGEVIATAPDSKDTDVEAAFSAARRTFDEGRWWLQ